MNDKNLDTGRRWLLFGSNLRRAVSSSITPPGGFWSWRICMAPQRASSQKYWCDRRYQAHGDTRPERHSRFPMSHRHNLHHVTDFQRGPLADMGDLRRGQRHILSTEQSLKPSGSLPPSMAAGAPLSHSVPVLGHGQRVAHV